MQILICFVKILIIFRTTESTNCDAAANGNQGCGTQLTSSDSYGKGLNNIGGGWYVMKRTQTDGVAVWFWGRDDNSVPLAVRYGSSVVKPDRTWGTPDAVFPSSKSCSFSDHFDAHQIIFDLTFCVSEDCIFSF